MQLKKFIALFCVLVLSIQVIPVKQIGSMLFSSVIQEEMPHSFDTDSGKGKLLKGDLFDAHTSTISCIFFKNSIEYLHFAITLPLPHTGEIPTPPPNIA